jgi:predicted ATPase
VPYYSLTAELLPNYSARLIFDREGDAPQDLSIDLIWLDEDNIAKAGGDMMERRFSASTLQIDLLDRRDLGIRITPSDRWQQLDEGQGFLVVVSKLSGRGEDRERVGVALWTRADRLAGVAPHAPRAEDASVFNQPELHYLREVLGSLRDPDDGSKASTSTKPAYFDWLEVGGFRGFATDRRLVIASPNGSVGSGLTVLVGANNSGKSTIVESFDALARASQNGVVSFSEGRRNREYVGGLTISLHRSDGQLSTVTSLNAGSESQFSTLEGSEAYSFDVTTIPSRRQFNPYFSRQFSSSRNWGSSAGDFSRTQTRDGFTGRLFELQRSPDRLKIFNGLLERVLGRPVSWAIDLNDQGSYYLQFTEGKTSHSSEGLGEGLISLLFILDALHDSTPDSLMVIDEPELSLHPQYLHRLALVIAEYAATRQIVYATHAPGLVSWEHIANGAVVARVHKADAQSVISQPTRSTFDRVGRLRRNTNQPHTLGIEANEVFFLEDGIVLLEGQEDVVYLPRVLEDLGLPPIENVFGWGAGGAENAPALLRLFEELGFKRVVLVLDNDKASLAADLEREHSGYLIRTIPAADIRTKAQQPPKPAKEGLLDDTNRRVRESLVAPATATFKEVGEYLIDGVSL